jgi:type 1 glutamine amidotransferase
MGCHPRRFRKCFFGFFVAGLLASLLSWPTTMSAQQVEPKIRVLVVDGQNNHDWQTTTPILRSILEQSGRFTVDVATSPAEGQPMTRFHPQFSKYQVLLSNYNGESWLPETQSEFESFVRQGGGFVCIHAADNAFPEWDAYNQMIGLGGWGGRTERSGPYVYLDAKENLVRDNQPGPGGHHGPQREFEVINREPEHPIMKGMPRAFWHAQDELYDRLRGPANNMHVLATAYAAEADDGRGVHEPVVMTIDYGKGRVLHITLGHADYSMKCPAFKSLLERGCEWAANGKVTIPVREDILTGPVSHAAER